MCDGVKAKYLLSDTLVCVIICIVCIYDVCFHQVSGFIHTLGAKYS